MKITIQHNLSPSPRLTVLQLPDPNVIVTGKFHRERQHVLLEWLFRELNRTDSSSLIDIMGWAVPSLSMGDTVLLQWGDQHELHAQWLCDFCGWKFIESNSIPLCIFP